MMTVQAGEAAAAFAADALYAYWDGQGDETVARTLARGRTAIGDALAAACAKRPVPLVSLRDEQNWFVEGACRDASGRGVTFAASAQLDDAGLITRCLAFHCPQVEPPASWGVRSNTEPAGALAILERYFAHLAAGELAAATACFSDDCLYSHPPYRPGTKRAEFRGRDELLAGFERVRGPRSSRAEIVCCVERGADCLIEGVVEGAEGPKGSFVSSASLDEDGLIRRYVAFYTSSRVARR